MGCISFFCTLFSNDTQEGSHFDLTSYAGERSVETFECDETFYNSCSLTPCEEFPGPLENRSQAQ